MAELDLEEEWQLQEQIEQELVWQKEQREQDLKEQGASKLAEKEWQEVQSKWEFMWQKEQEEERLADEKAEKEWRVLQVGEDRYRGNEEEEEDWRKENEVSSELGDYDLLQYRCEEDLSPELEWEQHNPQEQKAKEDWLAEQQEKEFRAIQRGEADRLTIQEVDEDAQSEGQQKDADEEADWLMIQKENSQSLDLQGEEEWRKIQLDKEQAEEEWREMQQENEAIPDLREEWWEMHQIADELTEEELRKVLLQHLDPKK